MYEYRRVVTGYKQWCTVLHKTFGGADSCYIVWDQTGGRLGAIYLPFDDAMQAQVDKLPPSEYLCASIYVDANDEQEKVAKQVWAIASLHESWDGGGFKETAVIVPATDNDYADFPKQLPAELVEHALIRSLLVLCDDDIEQLRSVVKSLEPECVTTSSAKNSAE